MEETTINTFTEDVQDGAGLTILPPESLAIPGVEIKGQMMLFPPDLPYEDWAAIDTQFDKAEMGLGWWRGDWYNHGEDHYENFSQVLEVTKAKKRTWQNNGSVCRQYSAEERAKTAPRLSFTHHAIVAYQERELRRELLNRAIAYDWSCPELREKLDEINKRGQEADAENKGSGAPGNEEFIPVAVPVTVDAMTTLALDHLSLEEMDALRDWLIEQVGLPAGEDELEPEDDPEPAGPRAVRLMREALDEMQAITDVPKSYSEAVRKCANWMEKEDEAARQDA